MQASGNTARLCFSVVLSLATAGIALRLFNIKLPQLHAHHIVDKAASRTSSAPAVEQLLSNDLFVGAPCLGCSNLLTQAASGKTALKCCCRSVIMKHNCISPHDCAGVTTGTVLAKLVAASVLYVVAEVTEAELPKGSSTCRI